MSERYELVARLRGKLSDAARARHVAADQIERDGREIERLRGALIRIREASKFWAGDVTGGDAVRYAHESTLRLARATLSGEDEP